MSLAVAVVVTVVVALGNTDLYVTVVSPDPVVLKHFSTLVRPLASSWIVDVAEVVVVVLSHHLPLL
ncbi:hypothetical protein E2C01_035663 [Portunus trituberculatus]|uniref:Uncharacterized protein n=1 Tax=Portunus trituberculatus TaxID=210409 RepID=A0A5B7F3R2_PORTR|nr:hypothetical protein [Portunus trituberculatus]